MKTNPHSDRPGIDAVTGSGLAGEQQQNAANTPGSQSPQTSPNLAETVTVTASEPTLTRAWQVPQEERLRIAIAELETELRHRTDDRDRARFIWEHYAWLRADNDMTALEGAIDALRRRSAWLAKCGAYAHIEPSPSGAGSADRPPRMIGEP